MYAFTYICKYFASQKRYQHPVFPEKEKAGQLVVKGLSSNHMA